MSLKDFAGQPVVVYFYPRDDTPGCTKEACQFNDNLRAFARAKVPVLGISADSAEKHQEFRSKYGLKFPLLTDADHRSARPTAPGARRPCTARSRSGSSGRPSSSAPTERSPGPGTT